MNRRGEEIVPTAFLEIVVAVFMIFLMVLFAVKMFNLFYAVDDNALNTYKLIVDTSDGFLANSAPERTASFTLVHGEDETFKGTIFGLYSDRGFQLTDPFPPLDLDARSAMLEAKGLVKTARLWEKECDEKPCLCFSKKAADEDTSVEEFVRIYENPYQCDPLGVPEGGTVRLSMTDVDQTEFSDDEFATVTVTKRMDEGVIRLAILARPSS